MYEGWTAWIWVWTIRWLHPPSFCFTDDHACWQVADSVMGERVKILGRIVTRRTNFDWNCRHWAVEVLKILGSIWCHSLTIPCVHDPENKLKMSVHSLMRLLNCIWWPQQQLAADSHAKIRKGSQCWVVTGCKQALSSLDGCSDTALAWSSFDFFSTWPSFLVFAHLPIFSWETFSNCRSVCCVFGPVTLPSL